MRIVALVAGLLLSGCVGVMVESNADEVIASPVPLKARRLFQPHRPEDRWACQATWDAPPSAKPGDYLEAWGEPARKSATAGGETWTYEGRQWCGFWVFAGVPVPFLLPLCETFDHIEFEGGIAVRGVSRRIVASGGGIAAVINPITGVFPLPFGVKPGLATDDRPEMFQLAGDGYRTAPCAIGATGGQDTAPEIHSHETP